MKETASSNESTTWIERIRSSYSVSQSSSEAGSADMMARVRPSPRSSTPFIPRRAETIGRKASATSEWTRRFSIELHTAGYCVLESTTISHAFS